MGKLKKILLIALLVMIPWHECVAEESGRLIETFDIGAIDWREGVVRSFGETKWPEPIQIETKKRHLVVSNAVQTARTNMMTILSELRIDSKFVLRDVLQKDENIKNEIDKILLSDSLVKDETICEGKSVKVALELPLFGQFSHLILPYDIVHVDSVKTLGFKKEAAPSSDIHADQKTTGEPGRKPSGLIVDAGGLGAIPALVPAIMDEQGDQVYGRVFVSREYAVEKGICGFEKSLESAQKNSRVGLYPLVVKGLRTKGTALSDIVISNADASKIKSTSENLKFMKECRVIIVVD